MNEKFFDTLEVCLQAIEAGADIESVLERYPEMADELRPMLEASLRARSLAATSVPDIAMQRGRARVLQHATEMRKSARSSRRSVFAFPRLAVSLALALIFILSGTGLVRASNGALPGDNLYPVKRTWEDMRLLLVINPASREELEDEFEQERLHEVDELLVEGRHETISFAGVVTEQNGDQWLVAGIPVQITPDSKLPADPVTAGASVMVEGNTNLQGFVEADRIELLEAGISLSPFGPVEVEGTDESDLHDDSSLEENDNGNEMEDESLFDANENGDDSVSNDDNHSNDDSFDENSSDSISNDDNGNDSNSDDNSNDNNNNDDNNNDNETKGSND